MLCAKFVEIGPVVLEQKMKMWNVYKQMESKIQCRWITNNELSEILTWTFSSNELKLVFVYHYPLLRKQLTRHCCNSLHSWQVNCLLLFVASFITGCSIWSCLIKYYIHNEDYCWISQMKKKLQEVKINKGFDCLNVMFILGLINCLENYTYST